MKNSLAEFFGIPKCDCSLGGYHLHGKDGSIRQITPKDICDILKTRRSKHIHNIERESEVIKNVVRDLCTTLAVQARDLGHASLAVKYMDLRDELEAIFPKERP